CRPISSRSRKPCVVRNAARAPFRSSSALVATVEPWTKRAHSRIPRARRPSRIPTDASGGVEGTFAIRRPPGPATTKSVKVPPTSTPIAGRSSTGGIVSALLQLSLDLLQLGGEGGIEGGEAAEAFQFEARVRLAVELQAEVGQVEVRLAVVGIAARDQAVLPLGFSVAALHLQPTGVGDVGVEERLPFPFGLSRGVQILEPV